MLYAMYLFTGTELQISTLDSVKDRQGSPAVSVLCGPRATHWLQLPMAGGKTADS